MMELGRLSLLGHYLRVLVLATGAISVVAVLVSLSWKIVIPAGTFAMLPPVLAALSVGRVWAQSSPAGPEAPDGREAWLWSVLAALAYLTVQILLLPLAFVQMPVTTEVVPGTLGLLLVGTVIVIPLHRAFLALGARWALQRG